MLASIATAAVCQRWASHRGPLVTMLFTLATLTAVTIPMNKRDFT
ncbi:hypothetical protein ACFYE6_18060 [Kocuria sp. CPCC 205316]